jgi:site-specific recombinase XerD
MKPTGCSDDSTEAGSAQSRQPKLLDRVRAAVRLRHSSRRTEEAYVTWIRRFIVFHGKRHPAQMGSEEIQRYLTHLAVERKVSASTQNQALSALLFLYRQVLLLEPGPVEHVPHAHSPLRVPVVLSVSEVRAVLINSQACRASSSRCFTGPGSDGKSLSSCA